MIDGKALSVNKVISSTYLTNLLKFCSCVKDKFVKEKENSIIIVTNYTYLMHLTQTRTIVFLRLMVAEAVEVTVFLRRFISLIYLRSAGLHAQR